MSFPFAFPLLLNDLKKEVILSPVAMNFNQFSSGLAKAKDVELVQAQGHLIN